MKLTDKREVKVRVDRSLSTLGNVLDITVIIRLYSFLFLSLCITNTLHSSP
jgi:hypothetical protein